MKNSIEQMATAWRRLRSLPTKLCIEGDYNYIRKVVKSLPPSGKAKTPMHPSRTAMLRVKDPLPVPEVCNVCSEPAVRLGTHIELYGKEYGEWPYVYLCECCGSYVGIHLFTNIPLGTLADAKTRSYRKTCKESFERLRKMGDADRNKAYAWLAYSMNIPVSQCHFGMFTVAQCEQARNLCTAQIRKMKEGG